LTFKAKRFGLKPKTLANSSYAMFTQLLHYVDVALKKGEHLPPFLAVIDTEKAAIMRSSDVIPFLQKTKVKWGKSASQITPEALEAVSAHIGAYFVSFKIATHEDEFISTVKAAIKSGDIIRTAITPDNLKQVFDKWVVMVGREITGVAEEDYALLFFADIMHDGTVSTHANLPAELLHKNGAPVFSLGGKIYELGSKEGYRQFWAIYHKPPKAERRDSLIPLDERSFKGAYYTPLAVVDKAYDTLTATLGKNWQKDYIVWDMCCGVGNLEVKHSNPRNIYMSTLDEADVDVMKATKTCVAAQRFQYDYLNDDIDDFGQIDYTLTNKVPAGLRAAIAEGKKILVLINPPYGEAANSQGNEGKTDIAKTRIGALMNKADYGYAARELFVQFLARIAKELPTATLAMFSTLKYVNAPNFEGFRQAWNASYKGGFIVHSKSFDGLTGNFPIGFLLWQTNNKVKAKLTPIDFVTTDALDKNALPIGEKSFYNIPNNLFLSEWMARLKPDTTNIPLKNAVHPQTAHAKVTSWRTDAIGYMLSNSNDLQNAGTLTALFSSVYSAGNGFHINAENFWKAAVVFSVRRLIKATWLNNRDQFLQPTEPLTNEFKSDCLLWMLFNGSNLTASADKLEWNGKSWSIVNHFIPFTEEEVGANGRFESDFMVKYLATLRQAQGERNYLSPEAKAVLSTGKTLWQAYFKDIDKDGRTVRDELKLNRPDVGWYQIRNALKKRNESGDAVPVDFSTFEEVYKQLGDKLRPQVYELGFLRV
jgi:hypothetical protein